MDDWCAQTSEPHGVVVNGRWVGVKIGTLVRNEVDSRRIGQG